MEMQSYFVDAVRDIPTDTKKQMDLSWGISDKIAGLLSANKMSQKDLAKKMHKTEAEVSRWLSGTHNFTLSTLAKISTVLGEDLIKV